MEMRPNYLKTFSAVALLAVSIAAAGCGNDSKADLVNGKTLFAEKCGACHVMARAGTAGVQGPDLDDAFRQARADGMHNTIEGVVKEQIALPSQGLYPPSLNMPADLVTGMDARDVAAYVSYAAANPGKDTGALANAGQTSAPTRVAKADAQNHLKIDADPGGGLKFDAGKATASAGTISFEMDNPSSLMHNIALKGAGVDVKGPVVGKGGKSEISAKVKPGNYTFFCSVPGHEQGGMKGTLTVK
jgi:plastocyanin